MSTYDSLSKLQKLPSELNRVIYLFAIIGIYYLYIGFFGSKLGIEINFIFIGIIFFLLAFGLYQLNNIARIVGIGFLTIITFIGALGFISFILRLGRYFINFQLVPFIFEILVNLGIPILSIYLIYSLTNDVVISYFQYPEKLNSAQSKTKPEEKKYVSNLGSIMDK